MAVSRGFVGVNPRGGRFAPFHGLPAPDVADSEGADETGDEADDRERSSEVELRGVVAVALERPVDAQEADGPTDEHEQPVLASTGIAVGLVAL